MGSKSCIYALGITLDDCIYIGIDVSFVPEGYINVLSISFVPGCV